MYKLICCDLDKTLLNAKHEIAPETMRVLKILHDQGVYISITTGRAGFDAKHHAELIGEDTYYMGSNGAILGQKDQIIHETILSQSQKHDLFDLIDKTKFKPIFVTDHHIYVYDWFHYMFNRLFYNRGQADDYLVYEPNLNKLKALIIDEKIKIHKVIAFPKWKRASRVLKSAIHKKKTFELAVTPGNVFEITGLGVSKGSGVEHLAEHLGIEMSEVIAFGDSENDISMLKAVGLGVAMDNAKDKVKNVADEVTLHHNELGVASTLKRVFEID